MSDEPLLFSTSNGLATIGPETLRIRDLLERRFLAWASECKADAMLFPPLMRVEDLDALDYFRNFPHLALAASSIQPELLADHYSAGPSIRVIPNSDLIPARYVLPSAACYNIYVHMRDSALPNPRYITTVATCFRNESEYKGLERLWGFSMREIICVGTSEAVQSHLSGFRERLVRFSMQIELPLEVQAATDPFFQSQSSRAVMQQLFPVKEEFVYGGSVAIASVNFHRNFFGERCRITTADERPAFSGCVAFGIERWLFALLDHFQNDVKQVEERLSD